MSKILFLNIVTKKKKMVEILEFDLTTLGFNVQNTLVPSRTLNRVPTVCATIQRLQKRHKNPLKQLCDRRTDEPNDRRTDGPTN